MRRLRSLLLTTSIAAAALAPGATAFAQGKASQPPTPSTAPTPKPGATTSTPTAGTAKPAGTAAPATTGTGATKSTAGTATGSSSAPTPGTGTGATTSTGTGTATGTGTGTGTATGTGTGTGTATGTGTGAGAATGTGAATTQPADSAETLFRRGNELAKKVGWDKAEPLYRAAWKLKQSYDIAANLGLALFQQQKWREAAEFLSFALRSFPASGKPENRALLETSFATVKAEVGTLSIDVSVNGANVSVDGRLLGISPIKEPVFVDPGKRTIDVTLDEYSPSHKTVDAPKGSSQEVKILLIPKPRTPPPAIAKWRPSPIYFIVGGSVTIAGLGAGVVMTAIANGKSSDADSLASTVPQSGCFQPPPAQAGTCAAIKETLADQGLFARAAVGSFAVAGIFAVGTGALMLYAGTEQFGGSGENRRAASSLQLVPVVDSAQKGLLVVGTF